MNINDENFQIRYQRLESQMKRLAEEDGDAFLPNLEPVEPVDYVFVCMEPSRGNWARTADEARSKVDAGFRNFTSSIEDFILHFCIQKYLCEPTQRYHLTDLSKGAMLVSDAANDRTERYDRWYALLMQEIDIIAKPETGIFAVGNAVAQQLRRCQFPRPFQQVIHYSPLAGRARRTGIVDHEENFEKFKKTMTLEYVLAKVEVRLEASAPKVFLDETLKRLKRKAQLTESQYMLIFNYKLAFEAFKTN